jgi:hypothetical protein
VLGSSLVYKEKEVLNSYRQKLEQTKADKNPRGYEKKALLEETDSDDDTIPSTLDFDEFEETKDSYRDGVHNRNQTNRRVREDFSDEERGCVQMLAEEEEFKM